MLGRTVRGVTQRPEPGLAASAASPASACARSTPWSTSPTSSPSTSAARCTCSTPTGCKAACSPSARRRRDVPGAQRPRIHGGPGRLRHRRRRRRAIARRRHGRRGHRLHRGHHRRVHRMRPVRPGRASRSPAAATRSSPTPAQRFERGIDPALLPDALEAATAHDPVALRRRGQRRRRSRRRTRLAARRHAALRAPGQPRRPRRPADDAIADPRTARLHRREAHRAKRSPSPCRPGATTSPPRSCSTRPPASTRPRAPAAAEGCAMTEPEADLVEEVLRIQGLDSIPPVSLPRASPVPAADADAAAGARGPGPPHARRRRAARMRHVQLHAGAARPPCSAAATPACGVLNPIAADLDQMRPTRSPPWRSPPSATPRAGLPTALLFEIGPAFTPARQENVAAGLLAGDDGAAPARPRAAATARWTPRRPRSTVLDALGLPLDSLSVTADAPGWYHPGRSGVVRQGPKLVLAHFRRTAPVGAGRRSTSSARRGLRGLPRPHPRAEAPQARRARPAAVPAAAPRLRLPRAAETCRPTRCCAPRAARSGR